VRTDELEACAEVWRDGINDYTRRLNQPDVPPETASLLRLYAHLQATDPERFVVATMPEADPVGGERIVAFAAAVMRERLWFLSMLFVRPGLQGAGLGRALLARVGPADGEASFRATATDSAQPISNALYASAGIVPRIPLLNLIGLPQDPAAFGVLPSGVVPTAFTDVVDEPGGEGHRRLATAVDALDRELLGAAHPADHRFLRGESRSGWLYRGPDGAALGYGYATEAGRIGPVAVRDPALLAPILGHLSSAVTPRGAFALWLPGTADRAVVPALQSGFRLDQFPVLLCWDQPFADLTRYLPISPGLL
jgi:GNAT superfamily N-acetyltransferase